MTNDIVVRPIQREDYSQWRPLWDGYNAFYGRQGKTGLSEDITAATWDRFFSADERVHVFVAVEDHTVVALAHFLFHCSTTRLQDVCYCKIYSLHRAIEDGALHSNSLRLFTKRLAQRAVREFIGRLRLAMFLAERSMTRWPVILVSLSIRKSFDV